MGSEVCNHERTRRNADAHEALMHATQGVAPRYEDSRFIGTFPSVETALPNF